MRNADRIMIRKGLTFTGTAMATTATTEITEGTVTDLRRPTVKDFFVVMTKASGATVAIVATMATMVGVGPFRSSVARSN